MRALVPSALVAVALVSAGCAPPVDLATALQIENVSTGWFDAGIVNGKNKLVPSLACTLKNTSDQTLVVLQLNAVFHRVNAPTDDWGTVFLTVAGSEGLAPGATAGPLALRPQLGYTGEDPREDMLHNSQFVDAKVDLLAKYGSTQWKKIGEYRIARQLLTR